MVLSPGLVPEQRALPGNSGPAYRIETVQAASRLRSAAAGADVDIGWMETPLDGEFSLIRQRRATRRSGTRCP